MIAGQVIRDTYEYIQNQINKLFIGTIWSGIVN